MNGKVVTSLGVKVDPEKDRIDIDGKRLVVRDTRIYILLYKPKGYISALSDPLRRPVVVDLLKKVKRRVFPVGRLDWDAEGALLVTNDGELSNRLTHPRFKVPKKYLVKVKDVPDEKDLRRLERGVYLDDGRTMPARVRFLRETRSNSWIELTVFEGRNRLVKRMCMAVGHPVIKLKRIEFAGLKIKGMKPGEYRYLTEKEIDRLRSMVG